MNDNRLNYVMQAVRDIMKTASYCSLITLDNVGYPQARLMHPFEPEKDLAVWLATNRRTRKVQRIQENPYVLLSYHDPETG